MEVERPPASYWKVLTGLRQAGLVEESEEIKAYVDRLRAGYEPYGRAVVTQAMEEAVRLITAHSNFEGLVAIEDIQELLRSLGSGQK